MISLRQHDRVGRSRGLQPPASLPSLDERAAIARSWAASTPQPGGTRRDIRRASPPRLLRTQIDSAVSAVVDPLLENVALDDHDLADLRAFAERMLSPD